jgi:type IV secretory pathway VirB2 component (pilin)
MAIRHTFFALAAAFLMLLCLANPAMANAAAAGDNLLETLAQSITGNIGFFIGLAITVLGLWTWIIKQETGAGITMIIGGVLITLVPSIFNGVHEVATGVMETFSSKGNVVNP